MLNNPTRLLFFLTLILGSFISISSTSWVGAWIGLEINLLSFIPLMSKDKSQFSTESALKYFLTQALASSFLLFMVLLLELIVELTFNASLALNLFIMSSLFLKMGAAPFHFWFPGVMEGLDWMSGLLLMTWQKVAPLVLVSYLFSINIFSTLIIISSVFVGSLGGFNQTSLRKIMAYSSINHLGWMLSALLLGEIYWSMYFFFYTLLSSTLILMFHYFQLSHVNQMFSCPNNLPILKLAVFTGLLSLGGLPPFLGFLPKWLIIQGLIAEGLAFLVSTITIMTLITLYYYLRVGYSAFLLTHSHPKWEFLETQSKLLFSFLLMLTSLSFGGLLLCTCILVIF